jgi:hypothetical protein
MEFHPKCPMPYLIILLFLFFYPSYVAAKEGTRDSVKKDKIKKGWNFGGLPIIAYDADMGLQYGALANIYYYGDGSTYPQYFHSFYFEVSRYTQGTGINQFFFDSPKLIPHVRITTDLTYLTEKALNFYGFNGYSAVYNPAWEDDQDTLTYKSRVYYRHERSLFRFGLDFQGKFLVERLRWLAGFTFLEFHTGSVDINELNKGKKEEKKLPDVPGLYDEYVSWGIIGDKEKAGGINNFVKLGMIYDTRDNEPNPMKGIWSEVVLAMAPKFLGDGKFGFLRLSVTHRQYFTLVKNDLSLAYRIGYQGTIAGHAPFYILPYMINSYSQTTTVDGLGGGRTIRGILRNRVVGDGEMFANLELRWKFYRFRLIRQNFYLALNAFSDAGMAVQPYSINKSGIPAGVDPSQYFNGHDSPHVSAGGGLRIAMNQNFIISADYGHVIDKRDGTDGIYVSLGYLF